MQKLSAMDEQEFVAAAIKLYKESAEATQEMRKEAIESRAFVAGNQWSDEDKVQREGRATVTYNRVGPFVDAVTGMYIQNRQEARYLPRTIKDNDPAQAEVINAAAEWVRDLSDAEDEEADAFIDLITTGLGATETKITFDQSPEGMIEEDRIDWVSECFWDTNARKRNLVDKRWVMRLKPWDKDEIEEEWPNKEIASDKESWSDFNIQTGQLHRADQAWLYKNDQVQELPKDVQIVVMFEWYEIEKKHRVLYQGNNVDIGVSRFNKLRPVLDENGITYTTKPIPMRNYYRAFISGDTLLERNRAPISKFSICLQTGKRCEKTGTFYGLVRSMKDPQRWANVFFSSILHTIATSGKGVVAETDAFKNIHKAREQWANPDEIIEANPGAVRDGKIMPKPASPYPDGLDRLMQHSIAAFNDVTGMPIELMGLAQANQPGIVEAQRRQAGITILSWAFDSARKFRKEQGHVLLHYILDYISDGRMVRISNKPDYVPLIKQPGMVEYDVIVDDAPSAPNQKDRVWAVLQALLPHMQQSGIPIPQDIFDYLPIPASLRDSWKQQMQPNPQMQKMQAEQAKMAAANLQAVTADKQAAAEQKRTSADLNRAKTQETLAMIGPKRAVQQTEAEKNAADVGLKIAGA